MEKPFWFPLYVNRFLSSTKVALMTTEEIGAYTLLLCHEWNDPSCSLPDNDDALRKLGRISGDLTTMRACFVKKAGRLINQILFDIWTETKSIQQVRSAAGAKGNAIRWGSPSDTDATRKAVTKHRHSQSHTHTEKKKNKREVTPHKTSMPEGWELTDSMRTLGTKKGMNLLTIEHEFEKCKTHHSEKTWTEKGWASQVWQTWVLNWISFGRKQIGAVNGSVPKSFQKLDTTPHSGEDMPDDVRAILTKASRGKGMPA